ncbi:PL29 family lyase N-terminal domain-containing protein [Segatella copri]|uniref:PL29 family lyase N-terminal domain-containing protein n=1 Tax=Segatella copri TaxID=165179 RepID=UPI002FEF6A85
MKRKYFSALLMGALTIASVSTFTSCKDYDDDISSLQSQIDKLNEMVSKIQGQIDKGAILTGVSPVENGVKLTLSNGDSYTITNGKDGAKGADGAAGAPGTPGKDADIWKIGEDGYWYKNDTKTDWKAVGTDGAAGAAGTAGTAGKDGKYYVPNPQTGTFFVYGDGDKDAYDSGVSYLASGIITATWSKDVLTLNGVKNEAGEQIVINLTTDLKALVFSPEYYYQGIEAFEMATYKFKPKTVNKDVNADKNCAADAPTTAPEFFNYAPDMTASYFLNPANAKVEDKAELFSFISADKKYTRATEPKRDFRVEKVDLSKSGMVTVHTKYNGDAVKTIAADNQVTVLALQYKGVNGTVTSDFAAVRATAYTDLQLNLASDPHVCNHLYATAARAINNPAQANLKYNDDKGIDLRELINTDRKYQGGACQGWDKNAKEDLVKQAGFKYSFELIGYHKGVNETSQSAHAAIAADGYTMRAQMPEGGKQQPYGYSAEKANNLQNPATMNREPLVRVILTDTVNNKIASVGYLKFKITDKDTQDQQQVFPMATVTTPYTIDCGDNNVMKQDLKWFDIEEQIIAQLSLSKTQFETTYDYEGAALDLDQFDKAELNTTALLPVNKIGVVQHTTQDVNGTETEVLKWAVNNQQAYAAFKAGKTSLTTYIRFTKKTDATSVAKPDYVNSADKYVYVKFTWTPSEINLTPSTAFDNGSKIVSYWYGANKLDANSGFAEIHGNVEAVGSTDNEKNGAETAAADDEFVFNISNTLKGNKLAVNEMAAPYAGLNSKLVLTYEFITGHGLYANADGDKIFTDPLRANLVATLDKTTGVVSMKGCSKAAKELLNAYAPKTGEVNTLDKVLTARVKVVATMCGNIDVPVENKEFDVKFIRPISITDATAKFVDGVTTTAQLNLTFVDWRGYNFVGTRVPNTNYFTYYGVKSIALDIPNAKTNLNNNWNDKLSDLTNKIKLNFNAPTAAQIAAKDFGTITYSNNGSTVGTFQVKIPATVTYDWGELKTEVVVTIEKTQIGGAKRK